MEVNNSPPCDDVQTFLFKLHKKLKIFDKRVTWNSTRLNLIAVSSRCGLLFVASPDDQLRVLNLKDLVLNESCPQRIVPLGGSPSYVSLNSDQTLLSVVISKQQILTALIFDIRIFASQNVSILQEIRLSSASNVHIQNFLWNPCQPDTLATCTSDGCVSVYTLKNNTVDVQSKPLNARCLSWSQKGKQIVTGNADGSLSQLKPDLSLVKNIPAPIIDNNQTEAVAIHWISNLQFSVVFVNRNDPSARPFITIVNTPKTGNPNCINYDDICFGAGSLAPPQYFLTHIPQWGAIVAFSSNSVEAGVLGTVDQNNWLQWIQIDEGRAELPLSDDKQENYPVGVAFDDSAIHQLPWGENDKLPFMPMVHVLSNTGTLVSFYVLNINPAVPQICSPPNFVTIPQNLLTLQKSQEKAIANEEVKENNAQSKLNESNFVLPTPTITSTPIAPKAVNSEPVNKPVSNLFQVPKEPVSNNFIKPTVTSASNPTLTFQNSSIDTNAVSTAVSQTGTLNKTSKAEITGKQNVNNDAIAKKQLSINSVSDETLRMMILKETNDFQAELVLILQRCNALSVEIGTTNEMKEMATTLSKFDNGLETLWNGDNVKQEIVNLKKLLINTCSMLAEARMQPEYIAELEQLAQLDPISRNKIAVIKRLMGYVESQLREINDALDEQWELFQDDCKKKVNALHGLDDSDRMLMPTLDKVYKPLVRQQDILARQLCLVKALEKSLDAVKPHLNQTKYGKSLLSKTTNKNSELSTETKNLLNLSIQPKDLIYSKYKTISDHESKYTNKKYNVLREHLLRQKTITIKPIKVEPLVKIETYLRQKDESTQISQNDVFTTEKSSPKETFLVSQTFTPISNTSTTMGTVKPAEMQKLVNPSFVKSSDQTSVKPVISENSGFALPPKTIEISKPVSQPLISQMSSFDIGSSEIQFFKSKFKSIDDNLKSDSTINVTPQQTVKPPISVSESKPKAQTSAAQIEAKPSLSFNFKAPTVIPFGSTLPSTPESPSSSSPTLLSALSSINTNSKTTAAPDKIKSDAIPFSFNQISTAKTSEITSKPTVVPPSVANPTITQQLKATTPISFNPTTSASIPPTSVFQFSPSSISFGQKSSLTITPVSTAAASKVTTTPIAPASSSNISFTGFSLPSLSITTTTITTPTAPQSISAVSSTPQTVPVVSSAPQTIPAVSSAPKTIPAVSSAPQTVPVVSSAPQATPAVSSAPQQITPPKTPPPISPISVFGQSPPAVTSSTAFGTPSVSSPTSPTPASVFGSASTTPATTSSIPFGSPTVSSPPTNLFGSLSFSTTTASTTPANVFGAATTTTTSAPTDPRKVFGAAATSPSFFNNQTNTAQPFSNTTQPFGSAGASGGSIFGGTQSTFGQESGFSQSVFGGTSTFGKQPSSGFFGGSTTFGGFGSTATTTSSSIFGQPASPTNTFGNSGNSSSIFGSTSPQSVFGDPSKSTSPQPSSVFGGAQQPSTVFGGASAFGAKPAFGSSLGTSSSFGSFQTTDQNTATQSGFGAPPTFAKPSVFGGSPAFGNQSAFGAAPTFGSSTFGSSPAGFNSSFGSPGKTFGSTSPSSGFGSPTQPTMFENLATQSTISFGNLAQQSPPPQPAPPFQSSSPSFSTWR